MVRLALLLFLLVPVGLGGLGIAQQYGVQLPAQNPGYLGIKNLPADAEIRLGVLAITVGRPSEAAGAVGAASTGLEVAMAIGLARAATGGEA